MKTAVRCLLRLTPGCLHSCPDWINSCIVCTMCGHLLLVKTAFTHALHIQQKVKNMPRQRPAIDPRGLYVKFCDREYRIDAYGYTRPTARIFRRRVTWMSRACHEQSMNHISLKENLDAMHKVTHCTGCVSASTSQLY